MLAGNWSNCERRMGRKRKWKVGWVGNDFLTALFPYGENQVLLVEDFDKNL